MPHGSGGLGIRSRGPASAIVDRPTPGSSGAREPSDGWVAGGRRGAGLWSRLPESVASGVKLPFLADDLFINYDDARSAAGFRVLAKLAEETQVLFFTHHEHLADLARDTLGPANVSACRLGELRMEAA